MTNSMKPSPSSEADSFPASQKFPCTSYRPNVHSHGNNPTITPRLSKIILRLHLISYRSASVLFSHVRLGLPGALFPSSFPTKTS